MTAPTLTIPSSMAEITPAWLTAALREAKVIHSATVTAADFTTIGEGVGIMGALARVKLTYDAAEDGAPTTLVATRPPALANTILPSAPSRPALSFSALANSNNSSPRRLWFG